MCLAQQQSPPKENSEKVQNPPSTESSPSNPSPTSAYALFLHREELSRKKIHPSRVSATKIHLTGELIARTKQNIRQCSSEDLEILARETVFRKNLQRHLHYRRMAMQQWMINKRKMQPKSIKK
ncbi:hypothetical protein KR009_000493 [Drosophila setifemur]|nr:hypothetical protein KR009_000493 [Drosophila setifemur]